MYYFEKWKWAIVFNSDIFVYEIFALEYADIKIKAYAYTYFFWYVLIIFYIIHLIFIYATVLYITSQVILH